MAFRITARGKSKFWTVVNRIDTEDAEYFRYVALDRVCPRGYDWHTVELRHTEIPFPVVELDFRNSTISAYQKENGRLTKTSIVYSAYSKQVLLGEAIDLFLTLQGEDNG